MKHCESCVSLEQVSPNSPFAFVENKSLWTFHVQTNKFQPASSSFGIDNVKKGQVNNTIWTLMPILTRDPLTSHSHRFSTPVDGTIDRDKFWVIFQTSHPWLTHYTGFCGWRLCGMQVTCSISQTNCMTWVQQRLLLHILQHHTSYCIFILYMYHKSIYLSKYRYYQVALKEPRAVTSPRISFHWPFTKTNAQFSLLGTLVLQCVDESGSSCALLLLVAGGFEVNQASENLQLRKMNLPYFRWFCTGQSLMSESHIGTMTLGTWELNIRRCLKACKFQAQNVFNDPDASLRVIAGWVGCLTEVVLCSNTCLGDFTNTHFFLDLKRNKFKSTSPIVFLSYVWSQT